MSKLEEIRTLKSEIETMEFSYQNVHRLMYVAFKSAELLSLPGPIPNKEIMLHQIQQLKDRDLQTLILSDIEPQIIENFTIIRHKLILALSQLT